MTRLVAKGRSVKGLSWWGGGSDPLFSQQQVSIWYFAQNIEDHLTGYKLYISFKKDHLAYLKNVTVKFHHAFELHYLSLTLSFNVSFSDLTDLIVATNGEPVTSKVIKSCIHQIQELIVVRLNQAVANKLISSVDYLRESFVGTLERCLNSLEKSNMESSVHNVTSNHLKQVCDCTV